MKRLLISLSILAMILAACAPLAVPEATQTPPPASATPVPPTPTPIPDDLTPAQRAVIQALAEALNLTADQIKLVSTEAVEWPDGCLGVHRIDVMCTQAMVPGFRIILEAKGQTYEYHTNQDGSALVLVTPIGSAGEPANRAVQALMKALRLEGQDITLISAAPVDWPDACLGVAQPGVACAQVVTPGWLIQLEANGLRYEYHTNADGSAVLPATPALTWKRAGGLAGFCDEMVVHLSGEVSAFSCKGSNVVNGQLTADELKQLQAWVKQFGPANIDQSDPSGVSDAMSIIVALKGVGAQQPTAADEQALSDWAQSVYTRVTK